MKEFSYTVKDPLGIHARPAGMVVKAASRYKSTITLDRGDKSGDARKIMTVMSLGIKQGMTVTVRCEGEDEEAAYEELKAFFENNL